MRPSKFIIKAVLIVVCLLIWYIVAGSAFLVFEGPDRHYRLDSDYVMWGWPGSIVRVHPSNPYDFQVLELGRVQAFAVLDEFIVGRTTDGWFAINRQTHRLWYPYSSQEQLKAAAGVVFKNSQLTTSWPWSRMIISRHTKIAQPLIALFFAIPLIGIRRIGKILKFPFKQKL